MKVVRSRRRFRGLACSLVILLAAAGSSFLWAQEPEPLPWEKAAFGFGGYVATFNSEVTFGIEGAQNGSINGEDRLGLDNRLTVFRAGALYRPGESRRNQLDFSYAAFHRDGSATLSREITIGGETFPVGADVSTVLNFDLIRGTYSYAIVQNQRVRIALGASVYVIPLKYSLEIESEGGRSKFEGADTTLPLPALAFRGDVLLVPHLFLKTSLDGTYLEFSDFRGALLDANVGLEYQPWKHFGIGAGYNYTHAHAETQSGNSDFPGANFVGTVDLNFSGLVFYGKVSF